MIKKKIILKRLKKISLIIYNFINFYFGNKIILSFLIIFFTLPGFTQVEQLAKKSTPVIDTLDFEKQIAHLTFDKKQDYDEFINIYQKVRASLPLDFKLRKIKQMKHKAEEEKNYESAHEFSRVLTFYYLRTPADNNFDSCVYYGKVRLFHTQQIESKLLEGLALIDLGIAYYDRDSLVQSLSYYLKAYQSLKGVDAAETSYVLSNLASIYIDVEDYHTTKKYLEESIYFINKFEDENEKSYMYSYINMHLVNMYIKEQKIDSALLYATKSLNIIKPLSKQEDLRITETLYKTYSYLLEINLLSGDQEKSEHFISQIDSLNYIKVESRQMLKYCLLVDSFDVATNYLLIPNDSVNFLNQNELEHLQLSAEYYSIIKDYEKENELLKKLQHYSSLFEQRNKILFASAVDLKMQEEKIKNMTITEEQKNTTLVMMRILSVVLLFILGLFYLFYRQKRAKNFLLEKDLKNEKIISAQAQKLKDLDKIKSNYFHNVSHELKTSVTLIKSSLNLLLKKHDKDKETHELLSIINRNGNFLDKMTNNILDLSKGEFKEIEITVNYFKLKDLIGYISPSFKALGEQKNIQFNTPSYVPDIDLYTDASKLIIILQNLLSNAFKYNQETGFVAIYIIDLQDRLQIGIKDNGNGISQKNLPHIFERYYQTENRLAEYSGVGIGLSVCKQYVEMLEGIIEVDTTEKEGSVFSVTIPKKISSDNQQVFKPYAFNKKVVSSNENIPLLKEKSNESLANLLIVEDNDDLREYVRLILSPIYNLSFAQNGSEAITILQNFEPDLIITDLMMPIMDGFEFLRYLRSKEVYNCIPVLMLTAKNNDIKTINNYFKFGLDDYMMKPFTDDVLFAHISNLLDFAENRKTFLITEDASENHGNTEETLSAKVVEQAVEQQKEEKKRGLPVLNKYDQEWLDEFEKFVEKSIPDYNLNLDSMAEEMAISVSQLNRKVNAFLGITPKRYIKEIRLIKARQLLESGNYNSVKSVAYAVGYNSNKVFSRNFKARFGKYPSDYIEKTKYS